MDKTSQGAIGYSARLIAEAIDRNTRAVLALARLLSERMPEHQGMQRPTPDRRLNLATGEWEERSRLDEASGGWHQLAEGEPVA